MDQKIIEFIFNQYDSDPNKIVEILNNPLLEKLYKLYNIPPLFAGNDIGSLENVLERRINRAAKNSLPDIILIDGGKAQLNAALKVFKKN